jgi:thiol-disulfide isomerase/thioredoxin
MSHIYNTMSKITCWIVALIFAAPVIVAQNPVVLRDTVSGGDDFFAVVEPELVIQRDALLKVPAHADFWGAFTKQFDGDFDATVQHKRILKEPNIDVWEMAIFNARRKQVDFYKNHPQNTQLSDDFKQFVEASIRYNYWHLLLAHPVIRANADTKSTRIYSLPSIMTENLDLKKIQDQKLLISEPYRQFLGYCVTYFNSKNRQFEKYKDMASAMNDKGTFATQHFTAKTLKYYLTRLILETCDITPASAIKQSLSQLTAVSQSEIHLQVAQSRCAEALNKKELTAITGSSVSNKTKFENFELTSFDDKLFNTKDFKGKYVYVDFWASWCGPCRQEFPYSKQMQEKLTEKQKKKIVFLNISVDESKDAWRKAIKELSLEGVNGWSPELATKLRIDSIPRYMLLDREGNVLKISAPRPSNPDTITELIHLIEK